MFPSHLSGWSTDLEADLLRVPKGADRRRTATHVCALTPGRRQDARLPISVTEPGTELVGQPPAHGTFVITLGHDRAPSW